MADRESVLGAYLTVVAELAGARVGALFQPHGFRPSLVAHTSRVTQEALDVSELAWGTQREALLASGMWRSGPAVVWHLVGRTGETVGLVYLDHVQGDFPTSGQTRVRDLIVDVLVKSEPPALGPAIAQHDPAEGLKDQLVLALARCAGSVATTARLLGVSRQTVYERIERFGISLREFRLR